jgi:hypothetical protein
MDNMCIEKNTKVEENEEKKLFTNKAKSGVKQSSIYFLICIYNMGHLGHTSVL